MIRLSLPKGILRKAMATSLAVALPVAGTLSLAAPAQAADARLDQAVAALRAITTLRADFTQTDRNGQLVRGELTLKNPGQIRFQYEDAVNMLIVSNGKSLTLIDYDVQQVQRWPIKESPLGALLDPDRDMAKFGKVQPTTNPTVISVEVRDPDKPEYGVITLIFVKKASAPGGLELVSWVALDSQNKRTTLRLSNHQYGIPVPASTFRWKDPRVTTRRPG